jgi:hypothetical protein
LNRGMPQANLNLLEFRYRHSEVQLVSSHFPKLLPQATLPSEAHK